MVWRVYLPKKSLLGGEWVVGGGRPNLVYWPFESLWLENSLNFFHVLSVTKLSKSRRAMAPAFFCLWSRDR